MQFGMGIEGPIPHCFFLEDIALIGLMDILQTYSKSLKS